MADDAAGELMAAARNNRKPSATSQRAAVLVEAAEMPDMQDTLAELLRTHGWQCSPPAAQQMERRS